MITLQPLYRAARSVVASFAVFIVISTFTVFAVFSSTAHASCSFGQKALNWAVPDDLHMTQELEQVIENLPVCLTLIPIPMGQMFDRYSYEMAASEGNFDLITMTPSWLGVFSPHLQTMPKFLQNTNEKTFAPMRDKMAQWKGQNFGQAISATGQVLYYRKDLFENPDHQKAFEETYGYPLAPPVTWDAYRTVAEYFFHPDESLYGTGEIYRRGNRQFWYLYSRAVSLTEGGNPFFDPADLTSRLESPPWQRALEDYTQLRAYNHPHALRLTRDELRDLFVQGELAMLIDWIDAAIVMRSQASPLPVQVLGVTRLPGTLRRWSYQNQEWADYETVAPPFLAFGGWIVGVPKAANERAWKALALVHEALSDTIIPPGPYSERQLISLTAEDVWSPQEFEAYVSTVRETLSQGQPDFRMPGYFAYAETFEIEMNKTLVEERDIAETLAAISARWQTLNEAFGFERQRTFFRQSLGMPPLGMPSASSP